MKTLALFLFSAAALFAGSSSGVPPWAYTGTPTDGQVWYYTGTYWTNGTSGDVPPDLGLTALSITFSDDGSMVDDGSGDMTISAPGDSGVAITDALGSGNSGGVELNAYGNTTLTSQFGEASMVGENIVISDASGPEGIVIDGSGGVAINGSSGTVLSDSGGVTLTDDNSGSGVEIISPGEDGTTVQAELNANSGFVIDGGVNGIFIGLTTGTSGIIEFGNTLTLPGGSVDIFTTTTTLSNGAASGVGTLTNAPASGNPTKWIAIDDDGTIRHIPAW